MTQPLKRERLPSYLKIHYGLRPAKQIERKMLCELFRRLSEFTSLDDYWYVGLGSFYFTDFSLFHKALGIRRMISIERDKKYKYRFDFNRPFKCIDIRYGTSTEVLPSLPWKDKIILWLDYDDKLLPYAFEDIKTFFKQASSGSMLLVTINAEPESYPRPIMTGAPPKTRLDLLADRVGALRIPPGSRAKDLDEWGTATISHRIIRNAMDEALLLRNDAESEQRVFRYRQLVNFQYRDTARMLTVGGLLYDANDEPVAEHCDFDRFEFAKTGSDPFLIEAPKMTFREIMALEALLPGSLSGCGEAVVKGIPNEDLEMYRRVYRYFPAFAEFDW